MNTNTNTNTNTNNYLILVADLAMNTLLPTKHKYIRVNLYSGRSIICDSYYMDATDVVMNIVDTVHKIPVAGVGSIEHITEVQYPELPEWYKVPEKSNALGWSMTNVRAVLNDVHYKSELPPIVLSTALGVSPTCLILYMSEAWSDLPVYIRHFFLDELYRQYVTMNTLYGVPTEYNRIYMHSYDDKDAYVGVRIPRMTSVVGGPVVYHSRNH
jgi:hypothetical protein